MTSFREDSYVIVEIVGSGGTVVAVAVAVVVVAVAGVLEYKYLIFNYYSGCNSIYNHIITRFKRLS